MNITVRKLTIGEGMPKICVPIVGKNKNEILEAAKQIIRSGGDLAEWRADWFEEVEKENRVLELLSDIRKILGEIPLLFTFRTKSEGGEREGYPGESFSLEDYCNLNLKVIESKIADIVDVELFAGDKIVKSIVEKGKEEGVMIIASNHDFLQTPEKEEILKRLKKMERLGADILKIAVMPQTKNDVLTLFHATLEAKERCNGKPLVTMSMGEMGLLSRLAGEFSGSAITFGAVSTSSAPGQINVNSLKQVLKIIHGKNNPFNLYLIGFMGAGKSTIAESLARELGRKSIEMDEELVKRAGCSIASVFEEKGEDFFRNMESQLIFDLEQETNSVISCGGGVVLRKQNIESMKKNGRILYLFAKPETIYQRVKDSKERPILNGNMNLEFIQELMEKRCSLYEAAADKIIETDGKSTEQICFEILKYLS